MPLLRFARHNAIALLALFVALGGSSYAALRINGSQIENRTISGKKLKRNTLGGSVIRESRVGKVPRARRADQLAPGVMAGLRVHCPPNTEPVSGVCAELQTRAPTAYGFARLECDAIRRRLPTYEELANLVSEAAIGVAPGGELTSSVYVEGGSLRVVTVTREEGSAGAVPNTAAGARRFRCVAYPSN